ncbi:hypothetical protein BH20VER1_BH20VER1_20630 [soil metagenome]
MSHLLLKKSRQYTAVTLLLAATFIASFALVPRSRSAAPGSGTLSSTGSPVTWVGTAPGVPPSLDESTCVEGVNCDTFVLTLSGTPADWVGKKARIVVSAANPIVTDYDVFIHKGATNAGPLVGSAASGGTPPEVIELDPSIPSIGTGAFSIRVVYFAATAADQYSASATVVGGVPTPTPTPTGTPTPTPNPAGVPRFVNHYAPPGVMEDAGEPTMGVNWNTENNPRPPNATLFNNKFRSGAVNQTFNGGTSLYYGGINNFFLRATFDDCASPALVQWDQIPLTTANATRVFYDPILYTDHWTGRTFVAQELGLTAGGSTIEFTDNDGDRMYPSQGGAPSGGIDHQTIGGGPFHAPAPPTVITPGPNTLYPHAVYYASQSIATATSQLSVDGGFTYPVQSPMFTAADCAGLHGHLKVAEDGTAFVPDKACSPAGVPFVFGGNPSVVVSENNGATWVVRRVAGADSDAGVDDPSVGVSWCPPGACSEAEKAARSNHIYLGFMYTDGRPGIAYSSNKGQSWVRVVDLGALTGIKHIAFPAVAVGDPGRATFAFFGTTTAGAYSTPAFPGVWHLYIATTFDFGVTWQVQNVSGDDPIQRGGICGSGTCRNLLDFFDAQIDKQGRILVAGEDGCIGGCVNGGPNSFTAKAFITRQSGGKRMFSIYDAQTAEPTLPGAPQVSAVIDPGNTAITLSWPEPDNGGSTITGYKIYRSSNQSGPFTDTTLIATVSQPGYIDRNFPAGNNFYVVTAINQIGESPYCKEIQAVAGSASPCDLPGIVVSNDLLPSGADNDSGVNTPVDPRVNAKVLYVAEPFIAAGTEQLFFTLQVAPSNAGSAPPNSQWFIVWQRQGTHPSDPQDAEFDRLYVAMRTNAAGTPSFEYGKFGIPINTSPPPPPSLLANTPVKYGDADSGSYNPLTGQIRIVLSNSKLRAIDGGAAKYQPGTDLAATNVRTYFNRIDPGQRSQNNASDITPDGTYTLSGNAACAPALVNVLDIFSRKTHGSAGIYDLRVGPLLPGGTPIVEPRSGDGANSTRHHVVMVFPTPVTYSGASVTPGTGGSTSAVSTSPAAGPSSEVIVSFDASDQQTVTINLLNVSAGGTPNTVSVPMSILLGDVNGGGQVNATDISQAKVISGNPIERDTFRIDVNVNGVINSSDISLIKSASGNVLPPAAPADKSAQTSSR